LRGSSRDFTIFAEFARTAVRSAASELSESRLVRAKLAEDAKRREERHNDGYGNRIGSVAVGAPMKPQPTRALPMKDLIIPTSCEIIDLENPGVDAGHE